MKGTDSNEVAWPGKGDVRMYINTDYLSDKEFNAAIEAIKKVNETYERLSDNLYHRLSTGFRFHVVF